MKILIKNGHVVDPKNKIDEVLDIFIENGKSKKFQKIFPRKPTRKSTPKEKLSARV